MSGIEIPAWLISVIISAALAAAGQVLNRLMEKDFDASDISRGLRANTRSTEEPLKIIYGETKVGGNDVFIGTSGDNNKYLWIVQTLAEGRCYEIRTKNKVKQLFLGDKLWTEYGGNVEYWFHAGGANQQVDSNLAAEFEEWTDPLPHTCYIVWKLTYDQDYFQSLPKRLVRLRGRRLYDFRNDTTSYSNNPVLCLYDYLTNTRYGLGFSSSKIDTTSWTSAANYCDTKGWEFNGAFIDLQPAQDIIDQLCMHFRGHLIWYDGKIYLRYSDLNYESSAMTIQDKHILQNETGQAQISIAEPSRFTRPDAIRVTFIDPAKDFVTDHVMVGDEQGVIKDLKLIGCTDRKMASDLAVYNLERSQLTRTISGTFRDDCLKLEPHDVVTFNSNALSISNQVMRIQEADIQKSGLINLKLVYDQTALYDDDYNFSADTVYTCTLPDPNTEPPNVTNITLTETTYNYRLRTFTRLDVSFSFAEDYPWLRHVEVWISFDNNSWEHLFNVTDNFFIDPVEEGETYYIKLITVSIWGVKSSGNVVSQSITGYNDAPESVSYLTASVNQNNINLWAPRVNDPDVELYEFRVGAAWNSAIHLASLRSPNKSLTGVKPPLEGGYTFWVNTLGNNGLYGNTPQSATVSQSDLTRPPDGWSDADIDETEDYL